MPETKARMDMDDQTRIDTWLAELGSGRLAQRMTDIARMAMVRHMYQTAQELQSPVEAEHSTQQA